MQIKRDLHAGTLLCSDNTAALLASYVVQGKEIDSDEEDKIQLWHCFLFQSILAEIGDYLESYNNNPSYLGSRKYFPHQTAEHEIRIMNFHKNHM